LSACSSGQSAADGADLEVWKDSTTHLYDQVEPVTATALQPALLSVMMPPVTSGAPYQTALALTELGTDGMNQMSAEDWSVATARLTEATQDGGKTVESTNNAGPPAYTAYEMAWADRMNGLFSAHERNALRESALGSDPLGGILASDEPDVFDIYVTVHGWIMLGGDLETVKQPTEDLALGMHALCDTGITASGDVNLRLLAMASFDGIDVPCRAEQVNEAWTAVAADLSKRTDGTERLEDSVNTLELLVLEQVRALMFLDDESKSVAVRSVVNDVAQVANGMGVDGQLFLNSLQKTAFLTGQEVRLDKDLLDAVVQMAVFGSNLQEEQFRGGSLAIPLADARALDVPIALPDEFLDALTVLERLAVAHGEGTGLTDETKVLINQVASADGGESSLEQGDMLDTVAPIMLLARDGDACWEPGIRLVHDSLAAGTAGLAPGTLALAVKLMEQCGTETDSSWRETALIAADGLMASSSDDVSLDYRWQATRVRCALEPDKAEVGPESWSAVQAFAHEKGGAVGSDGFLSLRSTHQVLSMVSTTVGQCKETGVLEPRR
jgi:hypothetical protein